MHEWVFEHAEFVYVLLNDVSDVAFCAIGRRLQTDVLFSRLNTTLTYPIVERYAYNLSGIPCMTRGRRDFLSLQRIAFSSTTIYRF